MPKYRRQDLQFSCPKGGRFYSYDSGTRFVGCCTVDPHDKGCNQGNLRPASFNIDASSELKDQQCSIGSSWYTCEATQPPFLGCCKSNPCQNDGCPVNDLTAGFLDSNPMIAAPFTSTVGSSATITSSVAQSTSTPTSNPAIQSTASKSNKLSSGAIAGVVVGTVALAILLILAAVFLIYRQKKAPVPKGPGVYHEKDGTDGNEAFNSRGLAHPEPTLAGSPIYQHEHHNPPVYSSVNHQNTLTLPMQQTHNTSSQTFELPSPDGSYSQHSGHQMGPSTKGLVTTAITPVSTFQATSVTNQHPSPISMVTEGSLGGLNARPPAEVRRYQMAYSNLP